jgi:hypothetical protein
MIVSLVRKTWLDPDELVERVDLDDTGRCSVWRSAGWATTPSTPVGRFITTLRADTADQVRQLAATAERAGSAEWGASPGAPVDMVLVGDEAASGAADGQPPAPWRPLTTAARHMLTEATASPVAALDLHTTRRHLTVVHLGTEAVHLQGGGRIRVAGVDANGTELREWVDELDEVADCLPPGWSVDIRLPEGFADGVAEIRAFLAALLVDGGRVRPVSLQGRPLGG